MNSTTKIISVAATLFCVAGIGCTDPTVAPRSTVTTANVFNDPNSYRAFLAKIYGGLIVTGQRGPDGNADIGGIDEGFGEYLRLYWYLQEIPTDEAVIGWNDDGLADLNTGTWSASSRPPPGTRMLWHASQTPRRFVMTVKVGINYRFGYTTVGVRY